MTNYKLAALGGTFDRFHQGHQTLIKKAFTVAQKITIGITKDGMNQDKDLAFAIESYQIRRQTVLDFVKNYNWQERCQLIELTDLYGPTLTNHDIDCLVVSPLTQPGAVKINQKRQELNLSILPIEVCILEKCSDGQHISSTRIREGEINRDGFVYQQIFEKDLILTDKQKQDLKQPLGELISNPNLEQITAKIDSRQLNVAIGDISSLHAHQNNLPVQVFVFDNHEQRQQLDSSVDNLFSSPEIISCQNSAGIISQNLVSALKSSFTNKKHLKIEGEEDLAVLPAILLLPLGSTILYGQPDQGIVLVPVTEEKKHWCKEFLLSS